MPNPICDLEPDEFASVDYVKAVNDEREQVNATFRHEQAETNARDQRNIVSCARAINENNEILRQLADAINSLIARERSTLIRLEALEEFMVEMRLRPPAQTINVTIPDRSAARTETRVLRDPDTGRITGSVAEEIDVGCPGFSGSVTVQTPAHHA